MSSEEQAFRNRIKSHLLSSKRLHKVAKEVLKANIADKELRNQKIIEVSEEHKLKYIKLEQKVTILGKKRDYLALKEKIESVLTESEAVGCTESIENICKRNKLLLNGNKHLSIIKKERRKFRRLGHEEYQYNKVIKKGGRITYVYESTLLEDLRTWKQEDITFPCHCIVCGLVYLSRWVFMDARNKKIKYPLLWDTKRAANVEWVMEYEMRNYEEISKCNFEGPKSCKYDYSQSSTSGRQPPSNASPPASTSYESSQPDQQVSDVSRKRKRTSKASTSGLQSQCDESSHARQQEVPQQFLEVFGVPTKRMRTDPQQSSTSGRQLPYNVSPPASTSYAHQQEGSEPYQGGLNVPMIDTSHIREEIQNYLKLDVLLEPAAKEVLDEKKDIKQVAQNYGLGLEDLESKVHIMQQKRNYLKMKVKMENAVRDVQNSPTHLDILAKNYKIRSFVLQKEYNNCLRLKDKTLYKYDKYSTNNCTVFTFMEESLLLQQLQFLKDVLQCPCQICALTFLLSLSYDFAQQKNIVHPWSEDKKADCNWLFQFIKGHTDEISIFEPPHSCKIKSRAWTNGSETSSSVDLEENVVRSISDVPLQLQEGCQQTEEFFKDLTIRHLTMSDIRSRIKSHLELSELLDEAAEEVIEENKDIASVALNHKLDFWILKRKVQIVKMRRIYIDLKHKFENAVNDIILHKPPFDIAKDNKIDERQLKAEYMKYLEKCRLHPNYTYEYDKTITPNGVFTYSEEKSLLQKLSHWKKDSRCSCQLCALQYLLILAHQFATENRICPIGWIEAEIADELWLLEFEMRYSREEMWKIFKHYSICKIESLDQEDEPTNTSYGHRAKRFKPSQTSNVHKPDIKDRIKSHLELSRRLDKVAKKILKKHEDVASAARQHELDPWIVKQKMHILNLRKEQFNMKNKLEPPINDIIFNRISILNAATKYAVDKDFLEKTLKEFKNSKCDIYIYDMLTMDYDGVFTFREEFSLLNRLRLESEDLKCCRSCTLQHLSSLAYQDAKQNKKQYPLAWNTDEKADEIWIYEYEMRHSVEISKYFNDECKSGRNISIDERNSIFDVIHKFCISCQMDR